VQVGLLRSTADNITLAKEQQLCAFLQEAARTEHPDSPITVLPTELGATGLATCYDLRFPELFRRLLDSGAETFLLASGWPIPRIEHWQVLTRARAIEDQAWVVACNSAGTHAGMQMGGHSVVVDPRGNVVAEAGIDEEILYAEVDPAAVREWRMSFPVLADRRL